MSEFARITMIAHCMKKNTWNKLRNDAYWGYQDLENEDLIHCSPIKYLWRVLPNFENEEEELVIICIDEEKLKAEVRYEDDDGCGRYYPHVYGPINSDAVTMVLDYLKDDEGHYMKNPELGDIADE